jgi:hypothetical protein
MPWLKRKKVIPFDMVRLPFGEKQKKTEYDEQTGYKPGATGPLLTPEPSTGPGSYSDSGYGNIGDYPLSHTFPQPGLDYPTTVSVGSFKSRKPGLKK